MQSSWCSNQEHAYVIANDAPLHHSAHFLNCEFFNEKTVLILHISSHKVHYIFSEWIKVNQDEVQVTFHFTI